MEAPITGLGIDGTAAAIQLTLPRVSKALVTSSLEVAAMEATITGLRIDRTAGPIKRALARVFGIGTDKAMKPCAYLWIANKQKLEDLPRRRLQHVADARFGHGLAWFKCRIEALSWQHLCKAGQAEHQACRPVVPARWRHAQLKMPTVCDMVTVCPPPVDKASN